MTEERKTALIEVSGEIHNDVKELSKEFLIRLKRKHHITSLNYLEMFSQFKSLVTTRKK